jgi:hypothetical protein
MFLKFTNAVKQLEGQSIVINMDKITSIFERKDLIVSDDEEEETTEKNVTILYAGPNEFWEVKESYLDVMARVSAA